jgi:hypothetical protein
LPETENGDERLKQTRLRYDVEIARSRNLQPSRLWLLRARDSSRFLTTGTTGSRPIRSSARSPSTKGSPTWGSGQGR